MYTPDGHGFSPLAQINGRGRGGEIYYYFNDQLGTPQELVTAQGEIVWSAVYKSYGNLAIDYQTVPQPLRLPGQYFDEESGLHYNRHRYYDPHCARYISQDPIGLAGGENAYSYVANPITWIDPLGLDEVCPGTEAGKGTGNTAQAGNTANQLIPDSFITDVTKHNNQLGIINRAKRQISGAHNQDAFLETVEMTGSRIVGAKYTDKRYPGLVEYQYHFQL